MRARPAWVVGAFVCVALGVSSCLSAGEPSGAGPSHVDGEPTFRFEAESRAYEISREPVARACTTAADCVRADVTCCPCHSGGYEVAVTRDAAARVQQELSACPEDAHCLLANECRDDEEPACNDGFCVLTHG